MSLSFKYDFLTKNVSNLEGVGPKIKKLLKRKNIEKISDLLNFKKLDVYIVNKDLSSPYKIDSELVEIEILGTLGK